MGHRFFFGNANGYSSVAKGIYVGSLDFPPDCDFSGNTSVSFNWNEHFSNCRLHIQIVPFHGLVGVPKNFETFLWIIVFWDFWSFCTNFRWIGFWQSKTRAQQCKSVRLIVFGGFWTQSSVGKNKISKKDSFERFMVLIGFYQCRWVRWVGSPIFIVQKDLKFAPRKNPCQFTLQKSTFSTNQHPRDEWQGK